jgi:hypothetical protein
MSCVLDECQVDSGQGIGIVVNLDPGTRKVLERLLGIGRDLSMLKMIFPLTPMLWEHVFNCFRAHYLTYILVPGTQNYQYHRRPGALLSPPRVEMVNSPDLRGTRTSRMIVVSDTRSVHDVLHNLHFIHR